MKDCKHPNAYLNRLLNTLIFWYCPDCKQELPDDWKERLERGESADYDYPLLLDEDDWDIW